MARPVLADESGPVHCQHHWLVVLTHVVDGLVERALEERRIEGDHGSLAAESKAGGHGHGVLLGNTDVEEPVRVDGLELVEAGAGWHARRDRDDPPVFGRQLDELRDEMSRVVGGLGDRWPGPRRRSRIVGHRFAGHRGLRSASAVEVADAVGRHPGGHGRQRGAVEPDLVALRGPETLAFVGAHVDQNGPGKLERPTDRLVERAQVVPRDDPDVSDAEVLEQSSGLGEVDHRRAQPPRELEGRLADHGYLADEVVVGSPARPPRG